MSQSCTIASRRPKCVNLAQAGINAYKTVWLIDWLIEEGGLSQGKLKFGTLLQSSNELRECEKNGPVKYRISPDYTTETAESRVPSKRIDHEQNEHCRPPWIDVNPSAYLRHKIVPKRLRSIKPHFKLCLAKFSIPCKLIIFHIFFII